MKFSGREAFRARANELLRTTYGSGAQFRRGQLEALEALVVRRQRLLVVERTGWGKSLIYFLATRMLREAGGGPTVVVSPLLSLMRNQLEAAERLSLAPVTINSTNQDEWANVDRRLLADEIDLLFVSPEQLGSPHFAQSVLPSIQKGLGLLVVDEAHCISDWGHDFRPDYRRIVHVVKELPDNVPLLATTATANTRVVEDVAAQLGPGLEIQRGPLVRESLALQTIQLADRAERLAWLSQHLPELPGTGIIYCSTIADSEQVSRWLQQRELNAPAYHSKVPSEERVILEQRLLENQCKALVSTVSLGMGFDKPDLGFVVHYQRPGSLVAYYQQVGRAGRGVERAVAVLLSGREDDEIQEYFIETAFPTEEETSQVLRLLERSESGLTEAQILQRLNLRKPALARTLKLLGIEGAIGKAGSTYFRTPNAFSLNRPSQEAVTRRRYAELERTRLYAEHSGCLMEFLERELDDPSAAPCGHCANCANDVVSRAIDPELVKEAIRFLKRDNHVVKPRKRWPDGGTPPRRGNIPAAVQLEEGRALCRWGDPGRGTLVREGKYTTDHFSDELVEAVADMIERDWRPSPPPEWVTAVPSLKRPTLVPDFARRLADRLGLPYLQPLAKVKDMPPQKAMQNSAQQARNALDAFAVTEDCPTGPVLLVDDIVDSGWTFTACGVLMREHGVGPVYPVALARATGGGDVE